MKKGKKGFGFFLAVLLAGTVAACGNGNINGTAGNVTMQYTVEQTLPEADATAVADGLIGNWTNYDDPEQFAVITKTASAFQYEDNDGKYPAVFENGKLRIKISDTESDSADVYLDSQTGHMMMVYQDSVYEFEKHNQPN